MKTIFTFLFILFACQIKVVQAQLFPNPATLSTGQGAIGTTDPIWLVSSWYSSPPNPMTISYVPALISNNCAPGSWVSPSNLPPPVNNGNWITNPNYPSASNTIHGYIVFRLTINLPPDCNGNSVAIAGNYVLSLSGYVDNIISDVLVNGSSTGINGGWYSAGSQLNMSLTGPWVAGINYIDIIVYNEPNGGQLNPYGLLLVANSTVSSISVCLSASTDTICVGETAVLTASGATTYSWSGGLGTNNAITVSPASTTTYTVTGTTGGATGTANIAVIVYPIPNVNILASANPICKGDSALLTANGGITYIWDTNPSLLTQQITVSPLQTTNYNVTISDINGCTASENIVIDIFPSPVADAGHDTSICLGTSATLTATGGIDYLWSTTETTSTIFVSPNALTDYIVTLTDNNGCSSTDNVIVTVNPLPQLIASPSTSDICLGDSVNLTVNGATTYFWYPSAGLSDATIYNPVASPLTTTNYYVTGTNQFGCINTTSVIINVELPPIIDITPSIASICYGNAITINASGANQYFWSPSSGLSSSTGSTIIASPSFTTTYTVSGSTVNGCFADTTFIVNVIASPIANFTSDVVSGCVPLTVNFTDLSTGNIQSWLWDFDDSFSNNSTLVSPSHTFNTPDTYNISLIIINQDGCSDTLSINGMINVYPNPSASFSVQSDNVDMNQPIISFVDQSINASYWFWNFGETTSGSENLSLSQNTSHTYSAPGEYTVWLTVSSIEGCTDSTYKIVKIQDNYTFWVPSAFSPNEDGINDFFISKGTGIDADNFKMYIFDRWGEEIYFTDSYNNPWNGTDSKTGELISQGVYVWVIYTKDRSGVEHSYIGRVTVIF